MNKNLISFIQEHGLEQFGRYYSTYRGIVVDNQDTDNTNNILVHIPSVYNGVKVWCKPKVQYGGPNTGFQYLMPKPGDIVYIEFEYGDITRGLWSYHGWATNERPEEFDNDTIGIITPSGNKIYLKEVEGKLQIDILEDFILNTKRVTINSTEKLIISTSEDNTITLDEEGKLLDIKCKNINLVEGKVGIPESTSLVEKLNQLEDKVNSIITKYDTHTHLGSSAAGPVTTVPTTALIAQPLVKTTVDDISSKTIKQPN